MWNGKSSESDPLATPNPAEVSLGSVYRLEATQRKERLDRKRDKEKWINIYRLSGDDDTATGWSKPAKPQRLNIFGQHVAWSSSAAGQNLSFFESFNLMASPEYKTSK